MTNALRRDRRENQKEVVLMALEQSSGNVRWACFMAGIDRSTFYLYKREDPEFAARVEDIKEMLLDYAEYKLLQLIGKGSFRAIKFYLTTKGKDRGYVLPSKGARASSDCPQRPLLEFEENVSEDDIREILEAVRNRSQS